MNNSPIDRQTKSFSLQESQPTNLGQHNSVAWCGKQLYKSLILSATSIGLGWLTSRFWRGSKSQETQTTLLNRKAVVKHQIKADALWTGFDRDTPSYVKPNEHRLFQKVAIVYRGVSDEIASTQKIPCFLGLALGGTGSLISSNIGPLVFGSTLCLPPANAESTIPEVSPFEQHQPQNNPIEQVKIDHSLLWAAVKGYAGDVNNVLLFSPGTNQEIDSVLQLVSDSKILRSAIQKWVLEMLSKYAANPTYVVIPLATRMKITSVIFRNLSEIHSNKNIGDELPFIREYLHQTKELTEEMIRRNQALITLLEIIQKKKETLSTIIHVLKSNLNSLNQKYIDFQKLLTSAFPQLDQIRKTGKMDTKNLETLAHEIQKISDASIIQVGEIELETEVMINLTNHLVKEAMLIAIQYADSHKKIATLQKQRKSQSEGNLAEVINTVKELKKSIPEERRKREDYSRTLMGIAHGVELVTLLARPVDPILAHKIGTVGLAAVTIAKSVDSSLDSGNEGSAMRLEPTRAIREALSAVYTLFFEGGDPSKARELFKIPLNPSKNPDQARDHFLRSYDRTKSLIRGIFKLQNDTAFSEAFANSMNSQQSNGVEKKDPPIGELLASYRDRSLRALHPRSLFPHPKDQVDSSTQVDDFIYFAKWAHTDVVDPVFTGSPTTISFESVAQAVSERGIDLNIQSLKTLAHSQLNLQSTSNVPNPSLWADGVNTFLDFLLHNPEFTNAANHRTTLAKIRNTGAQFQLFVETLQQSPQLYKTLIDKYRDALQGVRRVIRELMIARLQETDGNVFDNHVRYVATTVKPKGLVGEVAERIQTLTALSQALAQIKVNAQNLDDTLKKVADDFRSGIQAAESAKKLFKVMIDFQTDPKKMKASYDEERRLYANVPKKLKAIDEKEKKWADYIQQTPNKIDELVAHIHVILNKLENPKKKIDEISELITALKREFDLYIKNFREMEGHLQKAAEIHHSREQAYFYTQHILAVWSQIQPGIRQVSGIEKRLLKAMNIHTSKDEMYDYAMHDQALLENPNKDNRKILNVNKKVLSELDTVNSPLNAAIGRVGVFHVLLEAYVRLGYQSEYQNDYLFRQFFENVWTSNTIRQSIISWMDTNPENMPYVQIEDRALPLADQLLTAILAKAKALTLARDEKKNISLRPCGHSFVDSAQQNLHLFEAIMIND